MFDSKTHLTGEVEGVVTKWVDDERGRFGFAQAAGIDGSLFVHHSVVAEFDQLIEVLWPGDRVTVAYESAGLDKRGHLRRRATHVLAYSEGEVLEGQVLSIREKGFCFLFPDPRHGLGRNVYVSPKLLETSRVKEGNKVFFTYRQNEKGLVATSLRLKTTDQPRKRPVEEEDDLDTRPFFAPKPVARKSSHQTERKQERAEEDRIARWAAKGGRGQEVKTTSNPKKEAARRRKLAARKK